MLEETGQSDEITARDLLQVIMGLDPGEAPVSLRHRVRPARLRPIEHSSSITGAWRAARENARRARETLSTELWESINTTWHRWNGFGRTRSPSATCRGCASGPRWSSASPTRR